jgi:membrane associated rhomboid family serine protease
VQSLNPTASAPETFSLRGKPAAVTLEADGFHHPTGTRRRAPVYSAYRDITHLATSSRAVWIATRRSVYILGRATFVDPNGAEHLVRALFARIARLPDGSQQLARMAEIEEAARTPRPLRATWGLFAVCVAFYAVQVFGGDQVRFVGSFMPLFASEGDWWRLVTANLLHANLVHLVLNLMGLLTVGPLVERPLGSARTVLILAVSGLGSMAASAVASTTEVVGVSGVIFGLLAAVCWLELRSADRLPAGWRIPRRALFWMVGVSALLSFLPFIATAAHAGGFFAGLAATAVLGRRPLDARPSGRWVRAAALASLAVCALAVGAAARELLRAGDYKARYVERLWNHPGADPEALNFVAWEIAVDPGSSHEMLDAALDLAERAVHDTARQQAHILDTLAEVHFQLGHRDEALAAIDEAIVREPGNDYYQEQRRRFLGERPPDDRPVYRPEDDVSVPEDEGISV